MCSAISSIAGGAWWFEGADAGATTGSSHSDTNVTSRINATPSLVVQKEQNGSSSDGLVQEHDDSADGCKGVSQNGAFMQDSGTSLPQDWQWTLGVVGPVVGDEVDLLSGN
ncbi:hypothetical protein V6N11_001078 [Hibiscus sabdariffa]|uniref:Uncharacterized protein n=1 Tax=Hibiscus sabdariffa TaxID=183260 RepID=A0ABR2RZG2_9ROSI